MPLPLTICLSPSLSSFFPVFLLFFSLFLPPAVIQCVMPVAPLNGRIGGTSLSQRRLTVGALVTFSCNDGHTLVGESSIICTENGFWSHSPPFCK